jgi:hypothetical protein
MVRYNNIIDVTIYMSVFYIDMYIVYFNNLNIDMYTVTPKDWELSLLTQKWNYNCNVNVMYF